MFRHKCGFTDTCLDGIFPLSSKVSPDVLKSSFKCIVKDYQRKQTKKLTPCSKEALRDQVRSEWEKKIPADNVGYGDWTAR